MDHTDIKFVQFRSIYVSKFLSSCWYLTALPSFRNGHSSWTERGWSVWKVLTYGSACCCVWQHPVWKYGCIYRVQDQCQYGCRYRWKQQPATIERYLCDQTNCIKLQWQGGTWSVPVWLPVQVGTAACNHRTIVYVLCFHVNLHRAVCVLILNIIANCAVCMFWY
jgi:hypothetical protein